MDENTKKELQSAAFERLISHLRERKDVQNIDLMNLAGFCRNCLSKWYREEAGMVVGLLFPGTPANPTRVSTREQSPGFQEPVRSAWIRRRKCRKVPCICFGKCSKSGNPNRPCNQGPIGCICFRKTVSSFNVKRINKASP